MIALIQKHPVAILATAVAIGAVLVGLVWGVVSALGSGAAAVRDPTPKASASASVASASPSGVSPTKVIGCGDATIAVSDAGQLQAALKSAKPGAVIAMADGVYPGNFTTSASGTTQSMITLCGSSEAVLDGGNPDSGYVFHLDHASYWHLLGFSVTNGQKGVMADGTVGSVIEKLTVHHIGDEAIHLRDQSTDNTVTGNTVGDTGLRRSKFGEGIYIGTANSNWCSVTNCLPDNSDRNVVEDNTISGTTAENVDIKEGTSHGILRGNHFDGVGMTAADSWVDVKGNDWTIEGNSGQNSPGDGFQTHDVYQGWGTRNVFRGNAAAVNGPGYGFHLAPVNGNLVVCGNTASGAGQGLSNVKCSSG